ncbi:MAG TPA: outer membrane lipoprotein chaperone LolA [Woeseiaceae bacterium]|nr:outer membrane lipoprotein chaperone LolA [Woeseiaceae bacterium]
MQVKTALPQGIAALVLLLPALPSAGDEQADAGLALVRHFVDDVHTMSARFEQTLVDADDEVIETSSGTMQIRRPGRFRWTYDEPYAQILVADGVTVWNYDVDLAQVTVKPQAELLGHTPALLLGGTGKVLDDFEFTGSYSDRDTQWVRLRPRDTESGFTRVELGFNDGILRRMIFLDTLEQSTLVALFDVEINQPIADDRFAFTPPPDVDVVGTPRTRNEADM